MMGRGELAVDDDDVLLLLLLLSSLLFFNASFRSFSSCSARDNLMASITIQSSKSIFTSRMFDRTWLYSVAAAEEADLPGLVNSEPTPAALNKLFWRDPAEAEFLLETALAGLGAGCVDVSQLGRIWSKIQC